MLGDADAPMDVDSRFGQNQQVQQVLQDNDNAIGYMALAFSGSGIQAIGIEFEGRCSSRMPTPRTPSSTRVPAEPGPPHVHPDQRGYARGDRHA